MRRLTIILATAILCASIPIFAKTKHAPLPDQIIQAKTIFIDSQSGIADLSDKTYDELTKWGRFKSVSTAKDADVVLVVSANAYVAGYRTSSHGTASGTDTDTSIDVESQTTPEVGRTTYLTVVDPKTGGALWTDLRSDGEVAES